MMPSLRPILSVPDIDLAVQFYCEKLGFQLLFSLPDKSGATFIASVDLHGASIMLSLQGTLDIQDDLRQRIRGDMIILIALPDAVDIDSFFADVLASGVTIREAVADKFWGNREFTIVDPNGYCITFAITNRDVSVRAAEEFAAGLAASPDTPA